MFPIVIAFSKFHSWSSFQKEHYLAAEGFTEPLIESSFMILNISGRQPQC